MNNMKKFASILLALVMVLAMAAPAMAEEAKTGSITISNAVVGQTYTVYQILDLESYNPTEGSEAYSYKATTAWTDFINSEDIKGVYVNVDAQGYVTWVEDADVAAFAKLAQAYAKENNIANQGEKTAAAPDTNEDAETVELTFDELDLGYYLVDTTLGTLCSIDTTNPNVTMTEKNQAPTVEKEVEEDSNNTWGETNDADINQTVNFKATITVQTGAENYVLHDTMSKGLTYAGVTSVKIGENDVDTGNYTVTVPGTCGCTFEVKFDNNYIASLAAGTQIVVSYSATLNEDAVVGLPGNPNEVKLQYGDENKPSYTPDDKTITYTWDMKVVKYTKDGEDEVVLSGATFKLSTDAAGTNVLKFHNLGENKYEHCADTDCSKTHVTEITTDTAGTFNIEGLDAGTYYLTETKAPDGYNKLPAPVTITITPTEGTDTDGNEILTYTTVETKVENKSGTELPSTGGAGTVAIYTVGGLLVAAAVVMMISKKRAASK